MILELALRVDKAISKPRASGDDPAEARERRDRRA